MKKKRSLVLFIAVMIGFAALVAPLCHVEAGGVFGPSCMTGFINCQNNSTGLIERQCGGCPAGWTQIAQSPKRDKQRLLHAYAAQGKPSDPASANQPHTGSTLRSASTMGLSVFVLLVGLLLLVRLLKTFLGGLSHPLDHPQRYVGTALVRKHTIGTASLVALIGAALVVGSSAGPETASIKLPPGHRQAVSAVAVPSLNSFVGNFTSAIEIGGAGTTQIGGTAFDSSGNLYVTGGFVGNIVFNTAPQTTLTSTQDDDLFVAKYDSGGHPVWARAANGATGLPAGLSLDGGLAIAVDSQGNSFVGGGFVKTLAFKNASNNTVATLNSAGSMLNFEAFVAKYSADGTLLWAVGGMSGAAQDPGDLNNGLNGIDAIVLDGAGNPYVGGSVAGTNFLGTPVSAADTRVSQILLSRLNPATGAPVWVSVAGGTRNDEVMGLAIDASADLYVMGDIASTTTFPTQPPITLTDPDHFVNSFVAKYSKKGHCLWVKPISGLEYIIGTHLSVNGAGQIYVTGEFDGSVSFGSTTLNESEPGAHEDGLGGFLAKLDADGQTWLWAREFDGLGERVALDGAGNPFITGTFFDRAAFGAENQPTAQGLNSVAEEDQFVAKYDAAGNFQFAKALPGDGEGSENILHSALANVDVIPVQLVYNRATGSMNVCGDFSGSLTLDNLMLNSGANRHGFVAALETAPPPAITSAQLNGKNLLVSGVNFDAGAMILLNGIQQRTKNENQNPTGLLTGKKLGNQIAPGQSVKLQVRNFDGRLSAEFIFVRPTG